MTGWPPHSSFHVAIVGGGFAGTAVALALLRQSSASVTLIERRPERLARGLAYGAATPDQLLNVRASGMSAFADDPGHFVRWLDRKNGNASPFVRRRLYGLYLRELLAAAEANCDGRLTLCAAEAVDIVDGGRGKWVGVRGGAGIDADVVILACGNAPAPWPDEIACAGLPPELLLDDPWSEGTPCGQDGATLLIGTGLSAVDVALALFDGGYAGRVVMLSRRGLLPRPHDPAQPAQLPAPPEPLPTRLSALLAAVRRQARTTDWRNAVDALRPMTQSMWADADLPTRRRFLRHLRPWWDVHRHRLAPEIHARLEALRAEGRLDVVAGRISAAAPQNGRLRIAWRDRGGEATRAEIFDRVVNCSGVGTAFARATDPLLTALLRRGAVRADPLALGLDCDAQLRALDENGRPDPRLFCLGPLTRGVFWETTAVPDIRRQAAALAAALNVFAADTVPGQNLTEARA